MGRWTLSEHLDYQMKGRLRDASDSAGGDNSGALLAAAHDPGQCQHDRRELYFRSLPDYTMQHKFRVKIANAQGCPAKTQGLQLAHLTKGWLRGASDNACGGNLGALLAADQGRGQPQHARRELYFRSLPDYSIHHKLKVKIAHARGRPTGAQGRQGRLRDAGEAISLMQGDTVLRQGWFKTAVNGFRWLQERGRHKAAALNLRERLRQESDPAIGKVARAHLPSILEMDHGTEGQVASEYQTDEETWATFVLSELTRVATGKRPREDSGTSDLPLAGNTGGSMMASSSSIPCGLITHAVHLWPDGTWSTREDLLAAGRTDLLPPPTRTRKLTTQMAKMGQSNRVGLQTI